ncbi:MAG: hypothetical protein JNL01_11650 [Bdellovibrionales bacterium]|nr:hypothetical protein [Bdellovibrionales bacterium]
MSCPYSGKHDPSGPALKPYGRSDITYNTYLKIEELTSLQKLQSEPPHHDEMLFIVIHQAYELWFKLILGEIKVAMDHMKKNEVLRAHHFVKRCVEVMKLLVQQIHILETMTPVEFLEFRDRLMPASGFQSSQFRELEFVAGLKDEKYLVFFDNEPKALAALKERLAAPDLRDVYFDLLRANGFKIPKNAAETERSQNPGDREPTIRALLSIYQRPDDNLPLYLLTEKLVELDEYLGLWRIHHINVVERVIGFKQGTGGSSGVSYLKSTTTKKAFPSLWEARTYLEKV